MREALFIKRNLDKWHRYQHDESGEPDEQAERFVSLLDDLSYSRTFYPQSNVTRFINNMVARTYQRIYKGRRVRHNRVFHFYKTELPLILFKHRRLLLFSFLFFSLCITAGAFSSATNEYFIQSILGENYVAMTKDNIRNGDPFGVYRDDDRFTMFLLIALNNLRVAVYTFISGIAAGLGTLMVLFQNGVMIGAFEQMFFAEGLGWQSILVIWIHGVIEIGSIILAGTAGLMLGNGMLFPGTYSRRQSFQRAAASSLKLIVGIFPFILAAAFLETYVTYRMSNFFAGKSGGMPIGIGIIILMLSLALMLGYFVWYPRKVHQQLKRIEKSAPVFVWKKEQDLA